MKIFWRLIYQLVVRFYLSAIYFSSMFNTKAHKWVEGRRNWKEKLQKTNPDKRPVVWMHCASLGEFEQGRPVWEKLRKVNSDYFFLLSFFSPSGLEAGTHQNLADLIMYLPGDTASNADDFIALAKPKIAILVKYELWYHFIAALNQRQIKTILIAAVFRPRQWFFHFSGRFFLEHLKQLNHIFVQNEQSKNLLAQHGITRVSIAHDTRFDRVLEIATQSWCLNAVDEFCKGHFVFMAGSTWPADEKLLANSLQFLPHKSKLIIVPHEINKQHLRQIASFFQEAVLLSNWEQTENKDSRILIIDRMGILSRLYRYADIAYLGGGFGRSIHNVLEAVVYGIPVIFGPNYKKSLEAIELIKQKAARSISDEAGLEVAIRAYSNKKECQKAGNTAAQYVAQHAGGSKLIINYLLSDS